MAMGQMTRKGVVMGRMEKAPAIAGSRIVAVRAMTKAELEAEGWYDRHGLPPIILELSNGMTIYTSSDDEGNNFGVMLCTYKDKRFYVTPEERRATCKHKQRATADACGCGGSCSCNPGS